MSLPRSQVEMSEWDQHYIPNRPPRNVFLLLEPVDEEFLEFCLEFLGSAELVCGGNVVPASIAECTRPPSVQRLFLLPLLVDPGLRERHVRGFPEDVNLAKNI